MFHYRIGQHYCVREDPDDGDTNNAGVACSFIVVDNAISYSFPHTTSAVTTPMDAVNRFECVSDPCPPFLTLAPWADNADEEESDAPDNHVLV